MDTRIGNKIRESRKAIGMTQQELADKLGVSTTSIVRWEYGHTDRITTDKAKRTADVLNIDVIWLMGYGVDNVDTLIEEEEFKLKLQEAIRSWKDIDVKFSEADIQSIVEFIKFKAVEKWVTNTERHLPIEENVTM